MRFTQKALVFNRAEFNFGDKILETTVDDGRLKISFSVPYHEIGTKRSIKSFPEKAFFRFGAALLWGAVAGRLLCGEKMQSMADMLSLACIVIGFLLMAGRRFARFDATRIPLASGNTILVFQDSQHHAIMGEINRRRTAEIRRLNAEVDPLNHPQLELKKFLLLKDDGIISESEFEEAQIKIAALSRSPSTLF